jgi:putative membrane protein
MNKAGMILVSATALALFGCHQKSETADASNAGADTSAPTASNSMADQSNSVADQNATMGALNAGAAAPDAGAAAPAANGGQMFANNAAASDAFEIATSKLALDNSQSAAVKKFAKQMVTAHAQSTEKLKTAAAGLSPAITPDPTLSPDQQAKLDALKDKKGKEFDTAYIDAQVAGHHQTLDTVRSYAASGDVPAFKSFAQALAPIVAAHLNMAKALKS